MLTELQRRMDEYCESYNGWTESILKHYMDATEPKNTITELKTILEGFNSRLDRWNRRKDQWSWKQSSGTHTIRAAKRIKNEKVWR